MIEQLYKLWFTVELSELSLPSVYVVEGREGQWHLDIINRESCTESFQCLIIFIKNY